MANTIIQLKHSTVTGNVPSSLANGEISINSRDGKLFYSTPLGVVTAFNPYPGPSGLDTELQFNDGGSLGGSEKLTFNKTTGLLTVNGTVRANIFSDDGVDIFNFANNAFNTANANYTSAVTKLNVTNSGASGYLLDQYSGNNPTVYVRAGETIAFNLNVSGHPFMVRVSSGGANYDTGLTHVATDGTITTGSSAQGKIAGTLYWKVPYDIVGSTYVYQCSIHSGMVGNVVIDQPTAIAFTQANTAITNALAASNYANGAFVASNVIQTYVTSANANISLLQTYVTTANANITAAFAAANAATATDTTQNNSITAAFNSANAAFTKANNALANTSGATFGGILNVTGTLRALSQGGDEGGELFLDKAATNTTLAAGITIDVYQNKLRFFETGGSVRGVFIDMANGASAGVGTDLLNPTSSPDTVARATASAAFNSANLIQTYVTSANANISLLQTYVTSANANISLLQSYVTSANANITAAFAAANAATATDTTQNNSITAAFTAANTADIKATSAGVYANGAFVSSNTIQTYVTSANANISLLQTYVTTANANIATILATNITAAFSQANAAYTRANNSLNANTGGTVTGDITATSFITTGAFGNITGANTVYANNFVANTGFIQFSDGSKQYTANAGGGTTDTFARNQANAAFAFANTISAGSVDTFARNQANAAFSVANTAQATATSADGTASSAAGAASAAQSTATTANDTATSAFIQANAAFVKANTGTGNASFGDYFPISTDWGNFTDATTSAFGEDLTVMYDCRVDPITPRGYLLTKDFGYLA